MSYRDILEEIAYESSEARCIRCGCVISFDEYEAGHEYCEDCFNKSLILCNNTNQVII